MSAKPQLRLNRDLNDMQCRGNWGLGAGGWGACAPLYFSEK